MKHCIISFLIVAALGLGVSSGSAQTTSFTYQGQIEDGTGPLDATVDIRFDLHPSPTGGVAVASQTVTNVSVAGGLFSVTLNFGSGVFDGTDYWLELAVNETPGSGGFVVVEPRQRLTSAPYAVWAGRAATYDGPVDAGQLTGTIGAGNIAAGTITGQMLAEGSVGSAQLMENSVKIEHLQTVTSPVIASLRLGGGEAGERFGTALAWLGENRFAVAAAHIAGGRVDIHDRQGNVVQTLAPVDRVKEFGASLVALGTDRLLVGAPGYTSQLGAVNVGRAYVGNLATGALDPINNPAGGSGSQSRFGAAVAVTSDSFLGDELLVIGDPAFGNANNGRVYLFEYTQQLLGDTWELLTTLNRPIAGGDDARFGEAIAVLKAERGSDTIIVGAPGDDTGTNGSGMVYLFNSSGNHLLSITNPMPSSGANFGISVTAVGSSTFVVGAHRKDTFGAEDSGRAYIYNANGAFVGSLSNPNPRDGDRFAWRTAAVGTDQLLISARKQDDSGVVYLVDLNNNVLGTFTGPATGPAHFGEALAALDPETFLVGAQLEHAERGAVYLHEQGRAIPGLMAAAVLPGTVTAGTVQAGVIGTKQLAAGAVTPELISGVLNVTHLPPEAQELVGAIEFQGSNTLVLNRDLVVRNPTKNVAVVLSPSNAGAGVDPELVIQAAETGDGYDAPFHISRNATFTTADNQYHLIDSGAPASRMLFGNDGSIRFGTAAAGSDPATFTNHLVIRSGGNVGIGVDAPTETLDVNGNILATGTITPSSDRNVKKNLEGVDADGVLERVASLPIRKWTYKAEDDGVRHMGPMAQDFRAAFGLGANERTIATVDADGVNLAAIQGLHWRQQAREARIRQLEAEVAELKGLVRQLVAGGEDDMFESNPTSPGSIRLPSLEPGMSVKNR